MANINGVLPPPTEQASEANMGCDRKANCTTVADEPNTVKRGAKRPRHDIVRTRSGQAV